MWCDFTELLLCGTVFSINQIVLVLCTGYCKFLLRGLRHYFDNCFHLWIYIYWALHFFQYGTLNFVINNLHCIGHFCFNIIVLCNMSSIQLLWYTCIHKFLYNNLCLQCKFCGCLMFVCCVIKTVLRPCCGPTHPAVLYVLLALCSKRVSDSTSL